MPKTTWPDALYQNPNWQLKVLALGIEKENIEKQTKNTTNVSSAFW